MPGRIFDEGSLGTNALIREGDSLTSGGVRCGGELLDLEDPPTAIISGSFARP